PHPAKRASASSSSLTLRFGRSLLALSRFDACDGAAHLADPRGIVELRGRLLKPQIELLALELDQLVIELIKREIANLFHPHGSPAQLFVAPRPPSRVTTLVRIGSFAAPSLSASRAVSSPTPSISNMILPGFTRAAQNSGAPLPLPIR